MVTQSITIPPDLQSLVDREMREGGFTSREELLRQALKHWAEHRETLVALDKAVDDMEAGRMRPWEEFESEFRIKNNLPTSNDE